MKAGLLVGSLVLMGLAGQALGQVEYEFNTDSGQITRDGQTVLDFEGVPVVGLGSSGGLYTWAVLGDMTVPGDVEITFKGSSLASVLVGRDLWIQAGAVIRADAEGETGGPGGGNGGGGGTGGSGGEGGLGGGGANGEDGLRGQDAIGQAGGPGGLLYQQGGPGGDGVPTGGGMGGASGMGRTPGGNGDSGEAGSAGQAGTPGVNNPVFPAQGGTAGAAGLGGVGASQPGGGGFGGPPGRLPARW